MTHGKSNIKAKILDATAVQRALNRIAHQILEHNPNVGDMALIGIRRRGVPLALRLARLIREIEGKEVDIGILDITLYEEDLSPIAEQPVLKKTEVPFRTSGKTLILVDDVLYTGRTIRKALDALDGPDRPKAIRVAVLIDRGHRELPIHADYVGKNVPTAPDEIVDVMLKETDHEDQVVLRDRANHNARK